MPDAPLIVTQSSAVRGRIEQIAAAAGVRVDHSEQRPTVGAWLRASRVIIEAAAIADLAHRAMPKRGGVVVVSESEMTAPQWASCVALAVERVLVLDGADTELTRVFADAVGADQAGGGRCIAVLGACGGVGATTLAIAVATASRVAGTPTLLCDLDPFGAGLDVVVGLEESAGARWSDIDVSHGRIAAEALHGALPSIPGGRAPLSVLSYGRDHGADVDVELIDTVLDTVERSGGLGVLDLPRTSSPVLDRILARVDRTVLITTADVRGCFAAARATDRLNRAGASLGLVVRGPSPGGIGAADIAVAVGVPLLAAMRPQPGLDRAVDSGRGVRPRMRTPLLRAARAVLRDVWGAA